MVRDRLFEIENGLCIDDRFYLYVLDSVDNGVGVDGDYCFCGGRIYRKESGRWVYLVSKSELKKYVIMYG